jgi:adenylate kinase
VDTRTIFLGGCPRSGKSFLADEVVRQNPGVRHEVAGQLIKKGLDPNSTVYQRPVVADVKVADRFQQLLVREFRQIRDTFDGLILLDGHFVVPTREGPRPVSSEVFAALQIDAFVLLETDLETIVARLRVPPPQAWWSGNPEEVASLMKLEREHAEITARLLARPLVLLNPGTTQEDAVRMIRRCIDLT